MKTLIPFLVFCLVAICNAELRTWTAVNGKEVEAEFVSNEKGIVKLKLKSGKVFEVPANKLSNKDNEFISSIAKLGVNRDELEEREGIIYLKGSDTPYTGKFFVLRKNGQKGGEANFKDGKYDGLWVAWHKNGKKGAEKNFKDGKLISEKYWNDKGEPVESERQALGNNEEAISKATEASIAKSLNSMKQLTLALFSYARDHDERFPASLEDLIPDYLDDRFKSYLSMMCTDGSRKPWHYVAGITTESEADKVILYSPEPIEGKWLVGFVDGSVIAMEEGEFRALVKDSKKKLKYSEVFSSLRKKNSSNKDNLEMVNRYLSNGGKINQRNQFGGTLLHVASANGYKEIVKFLLSKGAKVNIKNNRGVTPLDLALNYKKPEVADMLRKKGAKKGSNLIENNP